MANVLGELFQSIADAIRGKTGETGTMKPIDFPSAIASIVTGSGGGGGEGSGESLQFANGSFNTGTTGVERVTITHGKNVMPDFIAVWKTGIATMDASTRPFMSAWGMKSKFASGPQAAVCCAGYAMAENDNGIDKATTSQQNSGYIFCPNETTFQVGRVDSGNGQFLFVPNSAYNWIAIYGMGGGGGSSADVRYVTFMNGTEVLYKKPVAVGDDCVDVYIKGLIDEPKKESTVQYHYGYMGWGASDNGAYDADILKNITEDKTVYAIYTSVLREYTITWLDDDGSVLKSDPWLYGTVPSYEPTKEGAAFDGWTPSPVAVTGDATYTAKWIEVIGGSCGDDARWTYNVNTKTLTISGTGNTANYTNAFNQPWSEYNAEIEKVVVNDGIKLLHTYLFGNLTALTSVSLASSVTRLMEGVFYQCSSLVSIELPSVTEIGKYAFRYCSALESITLHDGLKYIYERAFQRCYALQEVILPNTVISIGPYVFDNCTGLTSVTISSGVTNWSDSSYSFAGCTKLANVTLNEGLTKIAASAFSSCPIVSITIPASVTYIGKSTFKNTLTSATFANPNGWYVNTSSSATSGTSVTVTNPATAATLLGSTYKDYYWKRT